MEQIKDEVVKARPHLSKQSIATYTSILKNLYIKVFHDDKFDITKFNDVEKILNFLKELEPNKRKTILSALVILTDKKDYRELMLSDITEYNKEQSKQVMSNEQDENWICTEDIKKLMNGIEKNVKLLYKKEEHTSSDFQQIQSYIILCLLGGTYIPPRRSKDYVDFKIKNINKDTDNYLVKNNGPLDDLKSECYNILNL